MRCQFAGRIPPAALRRERHTIAISGSKPKVKKISLVSASTPSEATLETAPQAPQTRIVSSENASQRGIPKIEGMAAREVVAGSSIAYESGHFHDHLEGNTWVVAHAFHRLLSALKRHADGPWGQVDLVRNKKIERAAEVQRSVCERHDDAMLFTDTGHEVQFTALRSHA